MYFFSWFMTNLSGKTKNSEKSYLSYQMIDYLIDTIYIYTYLMLPKLPLVG
jgi:hypothetical protein